MRGETCKTESVWPEERQGARPMNTRTESQKRDRQGKLTSREGSRQSNRAKERRFRNESIVVELHRMKLVV